MQWDKVKNILLMILLAIDLFLAGNLGVHIWQDKQRTNELEHNVRLLLEKYGVTAAPSFSLPSNNAILPLSLDRNRDAEEAMAIAIVGQEFSRTEQENGAILWKNQNDFIEWQEDGAVRGSCIISDTPSNEYQAKKLANHLLKEWNIEGAVCTAQGLTVVAEGTIADQPVHNRRLTLYFHANNIVTFSGRWSFSVPFTNAQTARTTYAAADALLSFAANTPNCGEIQSMKMGYQLESDSARWLQLTPTWKIVTETGEYLVDCAKKNVVALGN